MAAKKPAAKKAAKRTNAKRPSKTVARTVAAAAAAAEPTPMTWQDNLEAGLVVAESVVPLLGPQATVAVGAVRAIMSAVMAAAAQGRDVTDAELDVLFAADARARIEGQVARATIEQGPQP